MSNTEREAERLPECMSKVEEGVGGVRGRLRTFQAKKWVKSFTRERGECSDLWCTHIYLRPSGGQYTGVILCDDKTHA